MEERLQKLLSACGLASRRTVEQWIEAGRVTVNGTKARLGDKADLDRDRIEVDGRPVRPGGDRLYLMLNKPRGYVTTLSDEKGRKTVAELVSGCGRRVWPVGRLDLDSEGLLLLTDDGELTQQAAPPQSSGGKRISGVGHWGREPGAAGAVRPHGSGRRAAVPGQGAAGEDQRRSDPAIHHHLSGEKPAGPAHVRSGGAEGAAPETGTGGRALPGPDPGARKVAETGAERGGLPAAKALIFCPVPDRT